MKCKLNRFHLLSFITTIALCIPIMALFAVDGAKETADQSGAGQVVFDLYKTLAAGIAIGIAACGAALAQGRIGAGFLEGASRNPQAVNVMRTPFILSLVFVETLVLFTILICLMILGKV